MILKLRNPFGRRKSRLRRIRDLEVRILEQEVQLEMVFRLLRMIEEAVQEAKK